MIEHRFKAILKKYEKEIASKKEVDLIEAFFDDLQKEAGHSLDVKNNLALKNRIYNAVEKKKKTNKIWYWSVAASILLLVSLGFYTSTTHNGFFNAFGNTEMGQIINSTKKGEQTKVTLPDGSLVILNGESYIAYPKQFNDSIREVTLKGQAFFDVSKNPDKPFVIQSGNITTKVLGTSFNIREGDAMVEVIVSTGRVNVVSQTQSVYLNPNQKVTYKNTSNKLYKTDTNAEITNLWWKGDVVLSKIKIQDLASELQKIYDIPFVFKSDVLKSVYLYSFRLSKNEDLSELIERINFITEVKLIKTKNMVEITKK
ncbi:FecR family protein [Algibacter sp. L4_22]|uniref:FecR family protein n=1 Tax=Algibacter sp. L4_22 TaxID=2942477 RepID=UPI00201B4E46|nr:FecR family protein [Algibacter sp. L4_22]MCL5129267.1 FecR family protein [Algibacter sp. L4_22]